MSYQILKGWPQDGALDFIGPLAVGSTAAPGKFVWIKADGTMDVATYASAGTNNTSMAMFCFDADTVKSNITALANPIIVQIDSTMYEAGTYTVNQSLTVRAGKLGALAGTERIVARVISVNATTGNMVVAFFGSIG